jgi:hypothetical protein
MRREGASDTLDGEYLFVPPRPTTGLLGTGVTVVRAALTVQADRPLGVHLWSDGVGDGEFGTGIGRLPWLGRAVRPRIESGASM